LNTVIPYFFISAVEGVTDLAAGLFPDNSVLVFPLSTDTLSQTGSFYKKAIAVAENRPFCLLIEPDEDIPGDVSRSNEVIDVVVSLSFHRHYIKLGFDKPLILFRPGTADPATYLSSLRTALISQGYREAEFVRLGETHVFSWPENKRKGIRFLPQAGRDLLTGAGETLAAIDLADIAIFTELPATTEIPDYLKVIAEAEERFRDAYLPAYRLLTGNRELSEQLQELRYELGIVQEKLDSKDSYHSSDHPATGYLVKQIKEITEFYYNEYDILPLWFKRLGQILKVIMGKRTFRSLYNDNVKKYKV
jgi:hypothetical protein